MDELISSILHHNDAHMCIYNDICKAVMCTDMCVHSLTGVLMLLCPRPLRPLALSHGSQQIYIALHLLSGEPLSHRGLNTYMYIYIYINDYTNNIST